MSNRTSLKDDFLSLFSKKIIDLLATSFFTILTVYFTKLWVFSKSPSSPFGLNKDVLTMLLVFLFLFMLNLLFRQIKSFIIYLNEKIQIPYNQPNIDFDLYSAGISTVEKVKDFYYEVSYSTEPIYDELNDECIKSISGPLCPNKEPDQEECHAELIVRSTYFKSYKLDCPFCSSSYKSKYSSDTLKEHGLRILNKKMRDKRIKKEKELEVKKLKEQKAEELRKEEEYRELHGHYDEPDLPIEVQQEIDRQKQEAYDAFMEEVGEGHFNDHFNKRF